MRKESEISNLHLLKKINLVQLIERWRGAHNSSIKKLKVERKLNLESLEREDQQH